jgi:hypothetical protein
MILRRIIQHFRNQEWTAIGIDFLIVVIGVFVGIQVANWNQALNEQQRRDQIIDGLVTILSDSVVTQRGFITEIDTGLDEWQAAYTRGENPVPFYYRHEGSDTPPKTWVTFEQMQLTNLFDPITLFDLVYFYSELDGIGQRYVRYITFVENEVLPGIIAGNQVFYDENAELKPEFKANMERLRDYQRETLKLTQWAECLIYRLETKRQFEHTCRRAQFLLEGMETQAPTQHQAP